MHLGEFLLRFKLILKFVRKATVFNFEILIGFKKGRGSPIACIFYGDPIKIVDNLLSPNAAHRQTDRQLRSREAVAGAFRARFFL